MQLIPEFFGAAMREQREPANRLKRNSLTFLAFLLFALAPRVAWGQFLYYYDNQWHQTDTLNNAINYTSNGGTIYMYANGNIGGNIFIRKNITIAVQNTSNYGNFTLTRDGNYNITVDSSYTLTIKNIIIDGNNTEGTNSLFVVKGTMNMTGQSKTNETIPDHNNCKIINSLKINSSNTNGAAVHVYSGRLVCNGVTFENNENRSIHTQTTAQVYGGGALAVHDGSSFSLTNCHFYNNKAYESGGAIFLEFAGNSSIRNCTFGASGKPNTAYLSGGAIYGLMQNGKTLDIEGNTTFEYNQVVYNETTGIINPKRAGLGGAVCLMTNSTTSCTFNIGTESSSKIVFNNNYSRYCGGALVLWCANSNARFKLCNFSMENNWTDCIGPGNDSGGGALFVHGANSEGHSDDHFIIKNGVIRNNHSIHYGGAMLINMHDCKVENVTFESNYTTVASNGRGGGVIIFGSESSYTHTNQFINCNFYKNGINGSTTTTEFGGAIYSVDKTNIHLIGCTVGGSSANANKATGHGGGVFIGPNSYLTIDSYNNNRGIVSYNEAVNGGGIYVANDSQGHTNIGSNTSFLPVYIKENIATGSGSTGGMGGGIYFAGNSLSLTNTTISNNTSETDGGGIYQANGKLLCKNNTSISDNQANYSGGGIYNQGSLTCTGTENAKITISGNRSRKYGGGVYTTGPTSFSHTIVTNNRVETDPATQTPTSSELFAGGGIYYDNNASLSLTDSEVSYNVCIAHKYPGITENYVGTPLVYGGGIYVEHGDVTISNSMVNNNFAMGQGGGIYINENAGTLTINGSKVNGNQTTSQTYTPESGSQFQRYGGLHGGGILFNGTKLSINRSEINGNGSTEYVGSAAGVGVAVEKGTASIYNYCLISSNKGRVSSGGLGGVGVYVHEDATLIMEDTEVTNNKFETHPDNSDGVSNGAGLFLSGAATLTNCTITGNTGNNTDGGGILCNAGSKSVTISNCTIANNHVENLGGIDDYGNGGGLYLQTGTVNIKNSYIGLEEKGNTASKRGGGIYIQSGAKAILDGNTIQYNTASGQGGGIYIKKNSSTYYATAQLKASGDNIIQNNTANGKGGGVYKDGSLKVEGLVTITNNTAGTAKAVEEENVYIPVNSADDQTILITGELACGSKIGVTKTKRWKTKANVTNASATDTVPEYGTQGEHVYERDDNFKQVRTVIAKVSSNYSYESWATDAFNRNVFFDDKGHYGVWSFNYHKTLATNDYSDQNCYFIETWRNFAATSFASANQIKNPEEFALFAKQVNTGNDYSGINVIQVADIDLALHYWEPIGFRKTPSSNCNTFLPFSGSYDGQGHLIRNAFSILPAEDMGVFGTVGTIEGTNRSTTIQRTFVINHDFVGTNVNNTSLGGLVGRFNGLFIKRCEAAGKLSHYKTGSTKNRLNNGGTGGLVGECVSGVIINSFTVSEISNVINPTGGISGYGGSIINCYTKNTIHNVIHGSIGAILGQDDISGNIIQNCYVVSSNIDVLAGNGSVSCCYAPYDGTKPMYATTSDKENGKEIGTTDNAKNAYYSPTIGADQLGYMYADNILVDNNGDATSINIDISLFTVTTVTVTGPLFESLNSVANIYNSMSYPPEAEAFKIDLDLWARPALAYYVDNGSKAVSIERPINGDLPVLMMDNYGGADNKVGQGGFRAVSTVSVQNEGNNGNFNGYVLQYSGPKRDETGNTPSYTSCPEIDGMLARSTASDSHFIYGDVSEAPSLNITANRISIYEHAAITKAGTLGSFDKTHVSITFDNSSTGNGTSTLNINDLPAQFLPRNWHLLSTPLNNAPIGFNYYLADGTTNTNVATGWTSGDNGSYANNPWQNGGTAEPGSHGGTEFGWLENTDNAGRKRYWMTGWTGSQNVTLNDYPSLADWTDGYFPSAVESTVTNFDLNQGCIEGTNEYNRYPYGMDFYSWYEPKYHYINFKRNGPNHWHSDPNANGEHEHLGYKPEKASNYASPQENVNEEILLAGKGYFASIAEKTLLQSSGQLGTNTKTIGVTCSTYPNTVPLETGWNLVGNPFHAYLDFDQLCTDNPGIITEDRYLVYNADGFGSTDNDGNSGNYGNGFSYYVKSGSVGGAYAHRYLHPHQGFFVKVGSGPKLNFTESQTVLRSQIGTSGSYRDDSRPAYPLVNLFLTSDKGCSDVCVVEFNRPEWGGATKLRDMYSGNGLFYAFHDNKNYAALFATPDAERIPLKFEPKDEAGDTYTLSWNTQNGNFHKLYLVDNITGVQYDMLRNSSYSFSGKKGDYYSRFYITFDVTGIEEEEEEDDDTTGTASTSFAFFDGSQWVVTNDGHGTATLDLIDLQGRVLHSTTLAEGQARIGLPDVAKGMYLMRMTNQNGMFVQKIVVK